MAAINNMTFDQPSYSPGAVMTLTIDYTADTPTTNPVTETATVTITDSDGTVTATSSTPFVVNEPEAGGDTIAVTDTGGRTWSQQSNNGSVAVFTATA